MVKVSGVRPAAGLKSGQFDHQETVPFGCSFIQAEKFALIIADT
jgi:hypothetical protein